MESVSVTTLVEELLFHSLSSCSSRSRPLWTLWSPEIGGFPLLSRDLPPLAIRMVDKMEDFLSSVSHKLC